MIQRFRLSKNLRLWLYLAIAVYACIFIVLIPIPVSAQQVLQTTMDSMQETEQWWDDVWKDTFDPTVMVNNPIPAKNISIYSFKTAVEFILGVGLIFWLYQYGQSMMESKGLVSGINVFFKSFLPILLIIIFLSDQGLYSRVLAYGLRDTINSWAHGMMDLEIKGQNIRTALTDQLVTQAAKEEISLQANKCLQMPQPAVALPASSRPAEDPANPLTIQQQQAYEYLECLEKLEDLAIAKQTEANLKPFASFRRFADTMTNTVGQVYQNEVAQRTSGVPNLTRGIADVLAGAVGSVAYGPVLSFTQWLWMSFLEMAMWLLGLFAPLFIATSIIPGRQNMFFFWLIEYFTIGLAKIAYIAVIAIVAAQLSTQNTLLASDMRFPMALGLFAPGVSLAVVTAGGIAAASSFRSQSIATAGAAASVVTSFVSVVSYTALRQADKRR